MQLKGIYLATREERSKGTLRKRQRGGACGQEESNSSDGKNRIRAKNDDSVLLMEKGEKGPRRRSGGRGG